MCVAPAARRMGLARALLRVAEEEARSKGGRSTSVFTCGLARSCKRLLTALHRASVGSERLVLQLLDLTPWQLTSLHMRACGPAPGVSSAAGVSGCCSTPHPPRAAAGVQWLYVHVVADNQPAVKLYCEAMGFEVRGAQLS